MASNQKEMEQHLKQTQTNDHPYGKAFFKTLFFGAGSAIVGGLSALPSLKIDTIVSSALEAGSGGLVIGGAVLGGLALLKQNPKVKLAVVIPMLYAAVHYGHQWFGSKDEEELSHTAMPTI